MTLTPEFCQKLAAFALDWSNWFLWAALIAAAVEIGAAVSIAILKAKSGQQEERETFNGGAAAAFLTALKGVLEALKGLPAWVAVFLAGLALLWMAGQPPELCKPPRVPPPTGQPAG